MFVAVAFIVSTFLIAHTVNIPILPSFVFSSISSTLSLYTILTSPMMNTCESLLYQNPCNYTDFMITSAISYMSLDLLVSKLKYSMIIHHAMVILIVLYIQHFQTGYGVGLYLGLTEISTLFLDVIYHVPDRARHTCKMLFATTFFIFRIVLIPYIIFSVSSCRANYGVVTPIFIYLWLHMLLNSYWMVLIGRKCIRSFSHNYEKQSKTC